jgi:hypothetical protein
MRKEATVNYLKTPYRNFLKVTEQIYINIRNKNQTQCLRIHEAEALSFRYWFLSLRIVVIHKSRTPSYRIWGYIFFGV